MRDYGVVTPKFWIGGTGKDLRGNMEAQLLALYLMTSPHANMIGVFHCPLVYMMHETGLTIEGASKGLRSLIEAGFCKYDEATEEVFVVRMAAFQIGEVLSPSDKRCIGVAREISKVGSNDLQIEFYAIYSVAFNLTLAQQKPPETGSPFEAPSKPLRSQEQEQEQEQKREPTVLVASKKLATAKAPPLPPCPVDQVIEVYHELLPELPRVRLMDDKRKRCITRTWRWVLTSKKSDGSPRACTSDEALGWMRNFFERARDNDFLMGRGQRGAGHENWRCDLDFLLTDKGMKHVIEKTGAAA